MKFESSMPFGQITEFKRNEPTFWDKVKAQLLDSSLVVVRGLPNLDNKQLINLATNISFNSDHREEKLLNWDFGQIMEMKHDPDSPNYLFSDEQVPFHWDGAFHKEPKFLLFYCTESNSSGGETVFANTERIWKDLSPQEKVELERVTLTYKTEKLAHYGCEIEVKLVQQHPLKHDSTVLRFAEEVKTNKNPVSLKVNSSSLPPDYVYNLIKSKVHKQEYCYTHRWRKGDLLIADNFSLIHGRNALDQNIKRSFKRLQIL